jgi:hypothetical protein
VANWAAAPTNSVDRTTPGRANALTQALTPFPPVWINEVQPSNLTGPLDGAGDRDPWIELYNAGTNSIDLSPFYLTDSYANLTRWQFPSGTTVGAGQFLIGGVMVKRANPRQANLTRIPAGPKPGVPALTRLQGSPANPAVMDYQEYTLLRATVSAVTRMATRDHGGSSLRLRRARLIIPHFRRCWPASTK